MNNTWHNNKEQIEQEKPKQIAKKKKKKETKTESVADECKMNEKKISTI